MEGLVIQEGISKDGTPYQIRYPAIGDAPNVLAYINKLSLEKTYIRLQGEQLTLEEEEEFIAKRVKMIAEKRHSTLFLVVNEKICGITGIEMQEKTESHVGVLGLSVDESVRGQGLGEKLFRAVIEEATKNIVALKIITLAVKGSNEIALSLYEKVGFIRYGLLPGGSFHQGVPVDEIFMYKTV